MATLRNKRKLAAVSRETPESSGSSRGRNVLDPELTQDYISQVSEEIEGMVTKKISKEFNKTESRILGALSKFDEFLLNPQVRTCSVVQEASRDAYPENRETHGYRSSNDPYPEGGYFPHHSGQLNSPETEFNSHVVTKHYPHTYKAAKYCTTRIFWSTEKPTFQKSCSSALTCHLPLTLQNLLFFIELGLPKLGHLTCAYSILIPAS